MRNLKKILAMALALIMSLSLMATASAADFKDADKINDTYRVAVDVLEGLGVFKGYSNGNFEPTGSITRAETAAIIYRIVTGDVEDKQVGIYKDYNLFKDVKSSDWFAGYVNFCANAEYIKGDGKGNFNPQEKVEGYAALAMILRAIGYTANGSFTGSDWRTQTARTGAARNITKNITEGTLRQNADRQTVAEILFQAILVNMVDHNVMNTLNGEQGYTEIEGQTLGKKTFGLEETTGIVVANEYANLDTNQVLANGKTDLRVGEETWHLNYGTEITDIGERRLVYTTNRSGVVVMYSKANGYGADLNKVTEFGHACDITTNTKFQTVAEMAQSANTEFYVNFDLNTIGRKWCDQRLEFSAVFYGPEAEARFDNYGNINISKIAADDPDWSVEVTDPKTDLFVPVTSTNSAGDYASTNGNTTPAYNYPVRYTKIIFANETIDQIDLDVLYSIFGTADNKNNNVLPEKRITGDVFVGTKSTATDTTLEERDLSNQISYNKFVEDYIKTNTNDTSWETALNGYWTKFVDYNKDGVCEYAFTTWSVLDEVINTYTNRNGDTVTEFNGFDDNTYINADRNAPTVRYMNGETPAVGDKVIAARIDNQWLVEPAKDDEVTVKAYSWREDEITTDKDTYGQSGIYNNTNMLQLISAMDDGVKYTVYFDHFGYVRAYEIPGGNTYALITELYYTNGQQGNVIDKWPMTVELTIPNSEKTGATTDEYAVASGAGIFTAKTPWLQVANAAASYYFNNWVQPAIAHLGVTRTGYAPTTGTPAFASSDPYYSTFWNGNLQIIRNLANDGMSNPAGDGSSPALQEFNYGDQDYASIENGKGANLAADSYAAFSGADHVDQPETASFTNVAIVNVNEGSASLNAAAQLKLNRDGTPARLPGDPNGYAVDYIQLDTVDIAAGAVRYPIGGSDAYKAANNNYVNAVHDTEYFIAYNGGVFYAKDFVKFPGLTNEKNRIHAAYAVARNTSADNADNPYWVADVIVYEVYSMDDTQQTSVSLAYYTPTRLSGTVQQVETLNSKYGPLVTLTPGGRPWAADRGQWGEEWEGYGFYKLYNDTEPVDNVMTARDIDRVVIGEYAANKIYAGTVIREAYVAGNGYYIDVAMNVINGNEPYSDSDIASIEITDKIYSITEKNAITDGWYGYNEAEQLRYQNVNNSQVHAGDKVIWVNDGAVKTNRTLNTTKFVVDMGCFEVDTLRVYDGWEILQDTPSWLISYHWDDTLKQYVYDTPANDNTDAEWQKIMYEQTVTIPAASVTVIDFNLALTGAETIQFAYKNNDLTAVLPSSTPSVRLEVPGKDLSLVELTVKTAASIAAIAPAAGSDWAVASVESISGGYKVVLFNTTKVSRAANPNEVGTIYSVAKVEAMITAAATADDLAEIEELTTALTEVKAAIAAAGSNMEYGTVTGDIDAALSTLGTNESTALAAAQAAAKADIAAYEAAGIDALPSAVKATLATKKSAADTAIDNADTTAEIEAAVKEYKDAVDAALKAANPNLETARAAALKGLDEYKADEVAALTGAFKTAVTNAKTTAVGKINAAASEATIDAAVAEYEAAVDAQITASKGAADDAALAAAKEAALAAVEDLIPATPEGVAENAGVVTALANLTSAINGASNMTILNKYYKDDALVETNSLVAALNTAIDNAIVAINAAAALDAAKTAAIGVVDAAIDAVTGAAEDEGVAAAKTTLVGKINACTGIAGTAATDVEKYVKNGALVEGTTEVDALTDAIALFSAKQAALAAVDAAIAAVTGAADDSTVKSTKATLVGKINACEAIAPSGGGAAGTTDVEYYFKNGALVSGTEVDALNDAILDVEKTNVTTAAAAFLAAEKAKLTSEEIATLDVSAAETALTNAKNAADATVASLAAALDAYKAAVSEAVQAIIDART